MKGPRDAAEAFNAEGERYVAAIGPFVLGCADSEFEVYESLKHYAGLSDEVGRALLSGAKVRQMMEFTLAVAHNIEVSAERLLDLEFVFAHLTAIHTVRDRVVHFGSTGLLVSEWPDLRILTNLNKAGRYGKHFAQPIGSDALKKMTADLGLICEHLRHHRTSGEPFSPYRGPSGERTAWLYKPQQLESLLGRSREDSQERKPRQRPSRGSPGKEK